MVTEPVHCPRRGGTEIYRHGQSSTGKKIWICRNSACIRYTFSLADSYKGYLAEVKQQITDMAMNGSGIRDTGRVSRVSPTTDRIKNKR